MWRIGYIIFHLFLKSAVVISGQLHALANLSPGTHWIGGSGLSKASLGEVGKEESFSSAGSRNTFTVRFTVEHLVRRLICSQCHLSLTLWRLTTYTCRTAQLTSRRCILNIYSTNILTEHFKHAAHSPFFSLQDAVYFIMLSFLVPVIFTF